MISREKKYSKAVSMYADGFSAEEIARRMNISASGVRYILHKMYQDVRTSSDYRSVSLDENSFENPIHNEKAMYWGGFLAADGSVSERTITLCLGAKDIGHIYKFKDFISSGHRVKTTRDLTKSMSFDSKLMIEDLLFFGIHKNKSLTYDPPAHCIWDKNFWRGMVDGDGYLSEERGYPRIGICGTLMMVEKFEHFVKNITKTNAGVIKNGNIKQMQLKGNPAKDLMNYLYSGVDNDIVLDRKMILASKFIGSGRN